MRKESSSFFERKEPKKLLLGALRVLCRAGRLFFKKEVLAFLLVLLPSIAIAQMVQRDGVTLTQAQETRAEAIGDQLRCLVCQNESIEGSSAALAHQLRVIIRQHVIAGDSDQTIMAFMVQRYGIFVLLKPPFSPLTLLLYASPFLALALGFCGFYLTRMSAPPPAAPLSETDRERLTKLTES